MRLLVLDGRMGASNDILPGVFVTTGADPSVLSPVEGTPDVIYRVHRADENGILAIKVDVLLAETDGGDPRSEGHGDNHWRLRADGDDGVGSDDSDDRDDTGHSHQHWYHHHDHAHDEEQTYYGGDDSHGYSQDHDHSHPHSHGDHKHHHSHDDRTHIEGHGSHRAYPEVVDFVESMNLPSGVIADATTVFRVLGEAEAEVHGMDLDKTHLREVGVDDAIADMVGVRLFLDDLGIDRAVTGPVAISGGETEMNHGTYLVPAPAVVNITAATNWSIHGGPVGAKLLTPTDAVILAHLAESVETLPSISIESSSYGTGGQEPPNHPDTPRAVVGDSGSRLVRDEITVLETNLDGTSPEILGGLQTTLKDAGAHDMTIVPTTMRKSHPGHLVKVVVKPEDAKYVAYRLAVETGTPGIREHDAGHRWTTRREFETVTLDIDDDDYEVSVRVASDTDGVVYGRGVEYDDTLTMANETGVPVREVMRCAADAVASEAGGT